MAGGNGTCGGVNWWRRNRSDVTCMVEVNKWSLFASWSCMGAKTINGMTRGAPEQASHDEVLMVAMVARPRRQPVPKAIAATRGGYNSSRRTARTRRS